MELIDKEGLKNCLLLIRDSYCDLCPKNVCGCDQYCMVPEFLENGIHKYIDEQMVVSQKDDKE